jgi:predicted DNA-binding antitoxin AbrB/MazE fold protein
MAGPRTVDAAYEGGVLKPLDALDLPERQRVRVTVDVAADERPDEALGARLAVYDGLTEQDVDAIEAIALDRRRFMGPPP